MSVRLIAVLFPLIFACKLYAQETPELKGDHRACIDYLNQKFGLKGSKKALSVTFQPTGYMSATNPSLIYSRAAPSATYDKVNFYSAAPAKRWETSSGDVVYETQIEQGHYKEFSFSQTRGQAPQDRWIRSGTVSFAWDESPPRCSVESYQEVVELKV